MLKDHRKRIAALDAQMERDNARMAELLELMADPDFYINEDASSDAVAEHSRLKQRLAKAEEEWFALTEELEAEMPGRRFCERGWHMPSRSNSPGVARTAHWAVRLLRNSLGGHVPTPLTAWLIGLFRLGIFAR